MVSLSGSLEKHGTALLENEKDIVWYLEGCGGMDYYEFEDNEAAYEFGLAVRNMKFKIDVEINFCTVRLFLPDYDIEGT